MCLMWLLFEVHTCFIDCYLIILNLKLYDRKFLFALKVAIDPITVMWYWPLL